MRRIFTICLVLLLLLSAVGCGGENVPSSSKKESEPFSWNEDIPYAVYEYNITLLNWETINVSASGKARAGNPAWGYHIVTNVEEVEDFVAACEQNLRENYDEFYLFPEEEEHPHQDPFPYKYLGSTREQTFDETFFVSQDLLIIDLCGSGCLEMQSRPEELRIKDGIVSLQIRHGGRYSTTADNSGNILLIPVPKGCSSAQVEIIRVNEWIESASDVI